MTPIRIGQRKTDEQIEVEPTADSIYTAVVKITGSDKTAAIVLEAFMQAESELSGNEIDSLLPNG